MPADRTPPTEDPTDAVRMVVVRLSEAFSEIWSDLTAELGVRLVTIGGEDPLAASPDVAAVLIAAGGSEREALDWLDRHEWPTGLPVLAIGADPSWRTAAQLVRRGASDYLVLPEDVEILSNAVAATVERLREARRALQASEEREDEAFAEIVGASPALRAVLVRAGRTLSHASATTLIIGETGTGKELLARALHNGGPRRGTPFVPVNCSALPGQLIESELFGHERGAFTDAHSPKPGLFEVADGGTLFLDEIGTLPISLQAKLLRVMDDHGVRRVGGTKTRHIDVRIIAATNADLHRAKAKGTFRDDLFYRLNVITHELPPLRERGDDVLLIATHVLERLAKQNGLPVPALGRTARSRLLGYHWPGNVRELRNAVERALFLSPPGELYADELVPRARDEASGRARLPFPATLGTIMRAAARASLERCGGNHSEAARQLSISRGRLTRLLDEDQASTPT